MLEVKKYDKTQLILSEKTKNETLKLIKESYSTLAWLKANIEAPNLQMGEIETAMGLLESYISKLTPLLGYDGVLQKEYESRYAEIRAGNLEIQRLTQLLGKETSADAVQGAMQEYEDIFRAWYESEHFHYAADSEFSSYGIRARLTHEMVYKKGRHLLVRQYAAGLSIDQKIEQGWLIEKDKYHADLLDRDMNKEKVKEMVLAAFPGARITKYWARKLDSENFGLETEIFVSYKDLELFDQSHEKIEQNT